MAAGQERNEALGLDFRYKTLDLKSGRLSIKSSIKGATMADPSNGDSSHMSADQEGGLEKATQARQGACWTLPTLLLTTPLRCTSEPRVAFL